MKDRSLQLLVLILVLLLGWMIGWRWGDRMALGLRYRNDYLSALKEFRKIKKSLATEKLEKEIAKAKNTLKRSRESGADRDEIKHLESMLHKARRSVLESQIKIALFRSKLLEAEKDFTRYYHWYLFYRLSDFMGSLFLHILNLLVVPLVAASVITGIAGVGDLRQVGRMGLRTFIYYLSTTAVSVYIGIILVQLLQPGAGLSQAGVASAGLPSGNDTGMLDTVLRVFVDTKEGYMGLFPDNILAAMVYKNILGVIAFSIFFGAALATVGERGDTVRRFFEGVNETILKLVHWAMYLLPAGIFGLIVSRLVEVGGGEAVVSEIEKISYYVLTVLTGLLIHGLIVLPLVLWILSGRNPLHYISGMGKALFVAFSTASSSATLPTTMECLEENNGISRKTSSFVLPLGATINMDGTALYEAVAALFIAQAYGVPVKGMMIIIVFLTATLAAVGAAGIPEAGLVTMVLVLNATGLPVDGIAMLLSVDWLLDRFRTTVNVWGDGVGAAVVESYEKGGP